MNNQNQIKDRYTSPEAKVYTVEPKRILCESTEKMEEPSEDSPW